MGDEPAQVSGDTAGGLPDTKPGRLMVHDPNSEDGMMPVEGREVGHGLIDMAFFAIRSTGFLDDLAMFQPKNVASFAAQEGLSDVGASEWRSIFISRQQIRMFR